MLSVGVSLKSLRASVASKVSALPPELLFANGETGAWYEPNDLTTVFQDASGTTPAGAGDPVGYLGDKSGNGNHATQSITSSKPTLRQNSEGVYYLEFDGVDDFLDAGTPDFLSDSSFEVFLSDEYLDDAFALSSFSNPTKGWHAIFHGALAEAWLYFQKSSYLLNDGAPPAPKKSIIYYANEISPDLDWARLNGSQLVEAEKSDAGFTLQREPVLGTYFYIGASLLESGIDYQHQGNFYGGIFRGAANRSDDSTVQDIESYLSNILGLQI